MSAELFDFDVLTRRIFHSCIKLKLYTCSVASRRNKFNPAAPSRAGLFRGPRGGRGRGGGGGDEACLMDCERVCACICIRESAADAEGGDAALPACVCVR